MIMSLLPCNWVMFVYTAYNVVMLLFFFIPLPFMVNRRFQKIRITEHMLKHTRVTYSETWFQQLMMLHMWTPFRSNKGIIVIIIIIQHSCLRSGGHWDREYLAPSGGGTGTGDWKTDGQHYRRCQGVHLPVPAAVRGTTEGECGLISKHVHVQPAS